MRYRLSTLLLTLALSASGVESTFHCSFDRSVSADHASGAGWGVSRDETLAPGRAGQALSVSRTGKGVTYAERGNLTKERGSIELWLSPQWAEGDEERQSFLQEEAPREIGQNAIWLWKYRQYLRFDVRDPEDRYLTTNIAAWKPGEWHHVVATWDCESGTCLYIDGAPCAERESSWTPLAYGRFMVGNDERGSQPAVAFIDELRLYPDALTAAQVAAAFAGSLARTRAPAVAFEPPVAYTGADPSLLFHLPLDGSTVAAVSVGAGAPVTDESITFAQGAFGQGARLTRGSKLEFSETGNLDKRRGTLSLWFSPDWAGADAARPGAPETWRCLFQESPRPGKRHGSNMMWLWVWGHRLRADVSDMGDRYIVHSVTDWQQGGWHHVVLTWDCRLGRRLYVDGERVRGGRDSRKLFLPMTWDAKPFPTFLVGGPTGESAAGVIDDLRIHDAPLSAEAIRAEFARFCPVEPVAQHRFFRCASRTTFAWNLRCLSPTPVSGTLSWSVTAPNGERVAGEDGVELALQAHAVKPFSTEFPAAPAGAYALTCSWRTGAGRPVSSKTLPLWGIVPYPSSGSERVVLDLVDTIDCAQELPPDRVVAQGETRVVDAPFGRYREAGAERHSRFAVRIQCPNPGRPYIIDWQYPDDKPRTMEMIAQTVTGAGNEYELQTGVFCGGEYPVSSTMMTQRCIFWPRASDMALIFMTAEADRPAAAATLRVYEVQGRLPKLPVTPFPAANGWNRHVGLYYEDPALCYDFGGFEAMPDFENTIKRLVDYMDYFGQNLFMYPGVWYHGPFYPSASQGTALQRAHPPNFIEYMLLRFEERGIDFIPTLNVHSLPSLSEVIWTESMLASGEGAKTPLSMLWNGAPNITGWHGTAPNYNPLHPDVRQAVLTMVQEMLDLYADSPAFKGVCFHLTKHCMLWFGDIDAGYNDYCIEAFQSATGTRIPVAADAPSRVVDRYRWLMANAREAWIAWRCEAIREFYGEVAEVLHQRRPDLRLILALYRPNKRDIVGDPRFEKVDDYVAMINREGGIDAALYRDLPNVVVDRTIYPADYRWQRVHRRDKDDPICVRELELDARHNQMLQTAGGGWVNMHDRYWEDDVGRRAKWDAFWGRETGWRVSTLNPNQAFCLESYVAPLAHFDLMAFTKGGFLIGTHGMETQLGEFARGFRALPPRPFHTLRSGPGAPVVRWLEDGDATYVYAVNAELTGRRVILRWPGAVARLDNLCSGNGSEYRERQLGFRLAPCSFQAFRLEGNPGVLSVDVLAPE